MDIWGVGCVMFEVVSLYPLVTLKIFCNFYNASIDKQFPGNDELD